MASDESTDDEDQAGESHEPRECMACGGSGQLISNLGGTPNKVPCPWCGGNGVRLAEVDAQAGWPANEPPVEPSPAAPEAAEQAAGAAPASAAAPDAGA